LPKNEIVANYPYEYHKNINIYAAAVACSLVVGPDYLLSFDTK